MKHFIIHVPTDCRWKMHSQTPPGKEIFGCHMLRSEHARLYLIFWRWRACMRRWAPRAGWRRLKRASLINMPLSWLNASWGRLMLRGAASGLKVTSCVLITQHLWPLEGNSRMGPLLPPDWAPIHSRIKMRTLPFSGHRQRVGGMKKTLLAKWWKGKKKKSENCQKRVGDQRGN